MTERQNVQTEHKWVGRFTYKTKAPYYGEFAHVDSPSVATLYDSPSDVPDDCTPVRVRVETWEEEGEPEDWNGEGKPDGFRIYRLSDAPFPAPEHPDPVCVEEAREILDSDWSYYTALPVRIPTETKRKVTLDPEPTETGCRCRMALERLWAFRKIGPSEWAWRQAEEAIADCDCKAPETP